MGRVIVIIIIIIIIQEPEQGKTHKYLGTEKMKAHNINK